MRTIVVEKTFSLVQSIIHQSTHCVHHQLLDSYQKTIRNTTMVLSKAGDFRNINLMVCFCYFAQGSWLPSISYSIIAISHYQIIQLLSYF